MGSGTPKESKILEEVEVTISLLSVTRHWQLVLSMTTNGVQPCSIRSPCPSGPLHALVYTTVLLQFATSESTCKLIDYSKFEVIVVEATAVFVASALR